MKLSELRKQHPDIKATSVKVFLEKLEELVLNKVSTEIDDTINKTLETFAVSGDEPKLTGIIPKETIIQAEEVFEKSEAEIIKKITPKEGVWVTLPKGQSNITIKNTSKSSEGLGDTIEKITKATGIKKVVDFFTPEGKDCGCTETKNKLNEWYRYKVECMVRSEYDWWTEFLKRQSPKRVEKEDVFEISRLFTRLFKQRAEICVNCPSGAKRILYIIEHINKVYESYKTN